MDLKLEDLLAMAMKLAPESRRLLAQLLAESAGTFQVRDSSPESYSSQRDVSDMTSVTVVLPDDLATQAQAAGLLGERRLAELIQRALKEQGVGKAPGSGDAPRRRLVREGGRLVVEALPGEQPITDAEIRSLLSRMEW